MDVLNTVVNILHLIADVVIGVTQVTWMISKDVFRDKPKAKHYSKPTTTIFPRHSASRTGPKRPAPIWT